MNARTIIITLLAATLALSACSTWDKLDRTEKGAVIGGGTGAIVGSEVGDGAGGAVLGGAAGALGGGLIGRATEDDDDDDYEYRRGRYREY